VKIMSVEDDERVVAVERLAESGSDMGGESQVPPADGGDDGSPSPNLTPPPDENDVN
jgi:hypothetical protein